jgi:hypothetical protein
MFLKIGTIILHGSHGVNLPFYFTHLYVKEAYIMARCTVWLKNGLLEKSIV